MFAPNVGAHSRVSRSHLHSGNVVRLDSQHHTCTMRRRAAASACTIAGKVTVSGNRMGWRSEVADHSGEMYRIGDGAKYELFLI